MSVTDPVGEPWLRYWCPPPTFTWEAKILFSDWSPWLPIGWFPICLTWSLPKAHYETLPVLWVLHYLLGQGLICDCNDGQWKAPSITFVPLRFFLASFIPVFFDVDFGHCQKSFPVWLQGIFGHISRYSSWTFVSHLESKSLDNQPQTGFLSPVFILSSLLLGACDYFLHLWFSTCSPVKLHVVK